MKPNQVKLNQNKSYFRKPQLGMQAAYRPERSQVVGLFCMSHVVVGIRWRLLTYNIGID